MRNDPTPPAVDKIEYRTARDLVMAWFMLAKTARVYEMNNDSYQGQSARFFTVLRTCLGDRSSCTIKLVNDQLLVDDRFVSFDLDDTLGAIIDRWKELGMGGLTIGDAVTPEQMYAFLELLWSLVPSGEQPYDKLVSKLIETGVDGLSLLPYLSRTEENRITLEGRQRMRAQARHTFFRAISAVKDVLSSATRNDPIQVARTKRVVHTIIDQISEDDAALVELASIKNYDQYTYAHCTNVCIYAVTLGFRLGLSRRELSELGFAALFHDIGKVRLPYELISKPARFDEFDWQQMHKHPLYGAMIIAKTLKLDSHMARAMTVALEHHVNPDHTGYPTLPEPRATNLYSRIVAIADSFDALSSGRIYIKESIPPDEVLRKLMYQMQAKFDAALLKMFVMVIGIYPVGSLVLLSDDSLAIVTRTNPQFLYRPEVRVIADRGMEKAEPTWLDLSAEENLGIKVIRVIDPHKHHIDLSRFIFSD